MPIKLFPQSRRQTYCLITSFLVFLLIGMFYQTLFHWWQMLILHIQQQQNTYRRTITEILSRLHDGNDWRSWVMLVVAGFTYGVLHAVGPGHGKAVISTFLLTQPSNYKSALLLAFGGAMLQGLSAIVWVGMTLVTLQWLIKETLAQVIWAERLSYLLLIGVGIYLIWRSRDKQHQHCGCGHHHPIAKKTYLPALIAIGIRPCTGSILALAVAGSWGLWSVGIAMTLAVSFGTALTVLSLALLTIYGRDKFAKQLTQSLEKQRHFTRSIAMIGGGLLILLGILLLTGSREISVWRY